MLCLIISIILFSFIVWGIPLFFLKKTAEIQFSENGFCNAHFVITTKNAEDSIEGIVRSVAWQISNTSNSSYLSAEVLVVDLGSTDCTFSILEKLAKEYGVINPMTTAEYIAYIQTI